jgi:hypothetical protein
MSPSVAASILRTATSSEPPSRTRVQHQRPYRAIRHPVSRSISTSGIHRMFLSRQMNGIFGLFALARWPVSSVTTVSSSFVSRATPMSGRFRCALSRIFACAPGSAHGSPRGAEPTRNPRSTVMAASGQRLPYHPSPHYVGLASNSGRIPLGPGSSERCHKRPSRNHRWNMAPEAKRNASHLLVVSASAIKMCDQMVA